MHKPLVRGVAELLTNLIEREQGAVLARLFEDALKSLRVEIKGHRGKLCVREQFNNRMLYG